MARRTKSRKKPPATTAAKVPTPKATSIPAASEIPADKVVVAMDGSDSTEAATPKPQIPASFGKRELIDQVVLASGIKKKAAKPVVEAMLKVLGEALSRGDTLNLQPLGKGMVKARKVLENAEVIELRVRRSKLAIAASEGQTADDSPGASDEVDGAGDDPLAAAAE